MSVCGWGGGPSLWSVRLSDGSEQEVESHRFHVDASGAAVFTDNNDPSPKLACSAGTWASVRRRDRAVRREPALG